MRKFTLLLFQLFLLIPSSNGQDFEAFTNLFQQLILPYSDDTEAAFSDEKNININESHQSFLKYGMHRIEDLDAYFPGYQTIGRFRIGQDYIGFIYHCDGFYGQAGDNTTIVLAIFDHRGQLKEDLVLYSAEGYEFDYADGDGIGDYSKELNSTLSNSLLIEMTERTVHYIGYDEHDKVLTKIDSSLLHFHITEGGRIIPLDQFLKKNIFLKKEAAQYLLTTQTSPDFSQNSTETWLIVLNEKNHFITEKLINRKHFSSLDQKGYESVSHRFFEGDLLEILENPDKNSASRVFKYFEMSDSGLQKIEQGSDNRPDRLVPFLSNRLLTQKELQDLQAIPGRLRLVRNELFAQYGYVFNAKDLKEYFEAKDWYTPSTLTSAEIQDQMTVLERLNVELIKKWEQ